MCPLKDPLSGGSVFERPAVQRAPWDAVAAYLSEFGSGVVPLHEAQDAVAEERSLLCRSFEDIQDELRPLLLGLMQRSESVQHKNKPLSSWLHP